MADIPVSASFTLPDLPQIDSDLARLCGHVIESFNLEALTRLPDKFEDAGRVDVANAVRRAVGGAMFNQFAAAVRDRSARAMLVSTRERIQHELLALLWWEIFDWEQAIAALGRQFAKSSVSVPAGFVKVGGKVIPIKDWQMKAVMADDAAPKTFNSFLTNPVTMEMPFEKMSFSDFTLADLHSRESHEDFEYTCVTGHNAPPGHGWMINVYCHKPGVVCWMRHKT